MKTREKDNHRGNSGFLGGSHGGLYLSVYGTKISKGE